MARHSLTSDLAAEFGTPTLRPDDDEFPPVEGPVGPDRGDASAEGPNGRPLPVLPLSPDGPPDSSGVREVVPPILESDASGGRSWLPGFRSLCGFLTSSLLHAAALIVLALIVVGTRSGGQRGAGWTLTTSVRPSLEDALEDELVAELPATIISAEVRDPAPAAAPNVGMAEEKPSELEDPFEPGFGMATARPVDWLNSGGRSSKGALGDRSPQGRAGLVGSGDGGPTDLSERAVERALRWLVAHQCEDGSWHFNHNESLCGGLCRNPGTVSTTTGATGMVLLAFLGAGYTHTEGEHQEAVRRGLYYLARRAIVTTEGADLQEGTMYAQGLATIALCEAYAMTGDPALRDLAHEAVRMVVFAQDKSGGGWRYHPGDPGDTTVTGWQLMALKSGEMAGLEVPRSALYRAQSFLDRVSCEDGAQYGYMSTDPRRSTTAVGLLMRMYGGWPRDNSALRRGVAHLARWGPSQDDIYYNYYATQAMFHWGGSDWKRWNRELRDRLVATQAGAGHESGSWYFPNQKTESGGRLCSTCLAVMTLEVYYRYMPLYGKEAFEGDR